MSNLIDIMPLRGYVVVDREKEQVSPAGIILSPGVKDKSSRGIAVAVGEGITMYTGEHRPMIVKPGDTVLFKTFTCKMNHNGQEYLIINEDDIMAIINPTAEVRTYE